MDDKLGTLGFFAVYRWYQQQEKQAENIIGIVFL